METEIIYFILGLVLGGALAIYFYESFKEKAIINSERFVSKKLKLALDNSSDIIYKKIKELKKDLKDLEKDEIIRDCYNRTNKIEE